MIYIGIDPGKNTGLAVWDSTKQQFIKLATVKIHKALDEVYNWQLVCYTTKRQLMVVFEDARQRTWFGNDRKKVVAKIQGAGSIKRDCSIWEDFCRDKGISFRAIPPTKGSTKLSEAYFKTLTRYEGKSSEHARDAAILVFGK